MPDSPIKDQGNTSFSYSVSKLAERGLVSFWFTIITFFHSILTNLLHYNQKLNLGEIKATHLYKPNETSAALTKEGRDTEKGCKNIFHFQ